MKILFWILCVFAAAIIGAMFKMGGIMLGAIPSAILYGGAIWLANRLCKKWDENHPK